MNWSSDSRGLMNHWTRLFIIALLLGVDAYVYSTDKSESTSYAAHVGGILVGVLAGAITLNNLEVSWVERNVLVPGAWFVLVAGSIGGAYVHATAFPPASLFRDVEVDYEPCCWRLLRCVDEGGTDLTEPDFHLFRCTQAYDEAALAWTYTLKYGGQELENTCDAFAAAAAAAHAAH